MYLSSASNTFNRVIADKYIIIPTGIAIHIFKFRKYSAIPKTADPKMIFIKSEYNFLFTLFPILYIT